ncbi:MAG: hypothetical protein ABWK53_05425 [Anaerolineales bacterium]
MSLSTPPEFVSETIRLHPFGEESCEHEIQVLQDQYHQYYYNQSRFNQEVLDPGVYLIVGRRGSGKTSLTQYFNFQNRIRNAHSIDVNEPQVYSHILQGLADRNFVSTDLAIGEVVKIWDYLIWTLIFNEYSERDSQIKAAAVMIRKGNASHFIHDILDGLIKKYVDESGRLSSEISDRLTSPLFVDARQRVLEFTANEPVIIAIDTFERYDLYNTAMMVVTASLIQCANNFNIAYAHRGIHVKAFVSAEIFPHIQETVITNPTKFIRDPVYLLWRPKDLMRLIAWRFYKYLTVSGYRFPFNSIDWNNQREIRQKLWDPFFGAQVRNLCEQYEQSLPYILRHTQMRPRQMVILCNRIARQATQQGKFPYFKDMSISRAIASIESELAGEILSSYSLIYPGASDIVTALSAAPPVFQGNYLDQVAKRTSGFWPKGSYSATAFRRLVTELGIVGRVRKKDPKSGIIEADFEYNMNDRLVLNSDDECVIHPMFYAKLQVKREHQYIVYPFPDDDEYRELQLNWL